MLLHQFEILCIHVTSLFGMRYNEKSTMVIHYLASSQVIACKKMQRQIRVFNTFGLIS